MKKIEFIPKSVEAEILVDKPAPSSSTIPEWYKKTDKYIGGKKNIDAKTGKLSNLGFKGCVPFLDSFLIGYTQYTWCDVFIDTEKEMYSQSGGPTIMSHRNQKKQLPSPEYFEKDEFTWQIQWIPKLPKGYSMLYTHPLNRYDLPFYSLSGIVDSDKFFYENAANHPFFLRKGFSGIIPMGTPIVTMIPFKRDSWKSTFRKYVEKDQIRAFYPNKMFEGYYKKNIWTKKEFK